MENNKQENIQQLIEEYKKHINAFSKVQDKLFTDLENLLDSDDPKFNDNVFDYTEYLARYGPKN